MAVIKPKKKAIEKPRYQIQLGYEGLFKQNYRKMLNSMNKTIILKLVNFTKDVK